MLENFYEKIMVEYAEGKNRIELHKARSQFFEWAGQFDETSNDFEVKMSLFMDWYLLDRPYSDGVVPINRPELNKLSFNVSEKKIHQGLIESSHGIYEFKKEKNNDLIVKDIFSGQKYFISNVKIKSAFSKDYFFEARIFEYNEQLFFSGSFCFHPPQANKYILKEFKLLKKLTKKMPDDEKQIEKKVLMNKLFRMKHKSEQYKHINIEDIYNNDSQVKV